jgi:hypothetical protein
VLGGGGVGGESLPPPLPAAPQRFLNHSPERGARFSTVLNPHPSRPTLNFQRWLRLLLINEAPEFNYGPGL